MKFSARWEPRWPAFAVGFYKDYKKRRYGGFNLILWALVLEVSW